MTMQFLNVETIGKYKNTERYSFGPNITQSIVAIGHNVKVCAATKLHTHTHTHTHRDAHTHLEPAPRKESKRLDTESLPRIFYDM